MGFCVVIVTGFRVGSRVAVCNPYTPHWERLPRGQRPDPGVGGYFQEAGRHSPDGCTAYGVTFYDAAYHAVALGLGGVFVTADERYVRRASGAGGVSSLRLWRIGSSGRTGDSAGGRANR